MSQKGFPHVVVVVLHKNRFSELLKWLNDEGHVLRETMYFGVCEHRAGDPHIIQGVYFKDANQAMMFKLTWGGQ